MSQPTSTPVISPVRVSCHVDSESPVPSVNPTQFSTEGTPLVASVPSAEAEVAEAQPRSCASAATELAAVTDAECVALTPAAEQVEATNAQETPVLIDEAAEDAIATASDGQSATSSIPFTEEPVAVSDAETSLSHKRTRDADADDDEQVAAHTQELPTPATPAQQPAVSQPKVARTESQQEAPEQAPAQPVADVVVSPETAEVDGSAVPAGRHSSSSASEAGTPTPPMNEKHPSPVTTVAPSQIEHDHIPQA